jgi:hypothetical protein
MPEKPSSLDESLNGCRRSRRRSTKASTDAGEAVVARRKPQRMPEKGSTPAESLSLKIFIKKT